MKYNTISIFDTSIANYNLGNQIIMDAVRDVLDELFPFSFQISLPIEDIKTNARKYNRKSQWSFVGGTNLLNSDIRRYRQWDLDFHNVLVLRNLVLLGCGWFQYEKIPVTRFTRWAYKKVLAPDVIHSVRDNYTLERMSGMGFKCINTGCPTLWRLTPQHIQSISKSKSLDAVVTLTDYNQDRARDIKLIETVLNHYNNVYIFPQGTGDVDYIKSLPVSDRLIITSPNLRAFNETLDMGCDYIGTRLHAGIRALQRGRRSYILAIDNRAKEMGRDFCLPVFESSQLDELSDLIEADYNLTLQIPFENISIWKNQFIEK